MIRRLIINDLKSNRLITISTTVFMAAAAMMLGLTVFLFATLYSSISSLMIKAETPHFLQMHTGELSEEEIKAFTEKRPEVEKMQICRFLNLENGQIRIGDNSFDSNMQDNGLSCQSEAFDYLLDADDSIIRVSPGTVYVPVAYRNEYDINVGDTMYIGTEELSVAGFMRDSQMNSMMASSKRFLVNEADYERLKYLGSEEYLIEYRLKEGSDTAAFATAYKDADLPCNGPAITYPLIKLMNALSDGIMVIIILLVSVVVLCISIMCIRYIVLTRLEKDRREIGMLKAVGISRMDIRKLYLSKYLLLSAIGSLVGSVSACVIALPLGKGMRELYGEADDPVLVYAVMIAGAVLAEAMILLSVKRTLVRTEKISAVTALSGRSESRRSKNYWIPVSVIIMAAVFMMIVPDSMKKTMSDPEFVRYMGIGNSQIRIDVRRSQDTDASAAELAARLAEDDRVDRYSVMETGAYRSFLSDGRAYDLILENGDHSIFPVNYTEGTYPQSENEIAVSILNAEETGLGVGDSITICKNTKDGESEKSACVICGIYSDITNGGKTAKGCINDATPLMWSVMYVTLKDEVLPDEWISEYSGGVSGTDQSIKIAEIAEYMKGMYGQTIRNIGKASLMTKSVACVVIMVVILLLMRLVIWRERRESSLKKALGFTASDIRMDYMKKLTFYLLTGLALGIVSGMVSAQRLAGILLGFMGARGIKFTTDAVSVFVVVPVLMILTSFIAALISLREIANIKAYECLTTRE